MFKKIDIQRLKQILPHINVLITHNEAHPFFRVLKALAVMWPTMTTSNKFISYNRSINVLWYIYKVYTIHMNNGMDNRLWPADKMIVNVVYGASNDWFITSKQLHSPPNIY